MDKIEPDSNQNVIQTYELLGIHGQIDGVKSVRE